MDRCRPLDSRAAGVRQRIAHGRPVGAVHVVRPRRTGLVRLRLGVSSWLETGFLAIFLCPPLDPRPFPRRPPPREIIWLLRWLTFRIMLGAGLIKLRGDPCWRQLTCLFYHYETQPIPNPLSRTLHFMPGWFHRAGVLLQSPDGAGGALVRLRAAPRAAGRRPGPSSRSRSRHRQREPVVPELAHDRPGVGLLRRRIPARLMPRMFGRLAEASGSRGRAELRERVAPRRRARAACWFCFARWWRGSRSPWS